MRSVIVLLIVVNAAGPVRAQSVSSALPRAFVGAGVAAITSDADARMRLFEDPSAFGWSLEAGIAILPRLGAGVELSHPPGVSATTSGHSFESSGSQREVVLAGLLRGRVAAEPRWALDVVGGAGVLFQHHELVRAPCSGCPPTFSDTLDHRAPAFVLGGDLPVRLAAHVSIAATARWWLLQRGDHLSEVPVLVPWQYEWTSSTRLALGIGARATW